MTRSSFIVPNRLAFAPSLPRAIGRHTFLSSSPLFRAAMPFSPSAKSPVRSAPKSPVPVQTLQTTTPTGVDSTQHNRSDEIAFVRRQRHYAATPATKYVLDPSTLRLAEHRASPALLATLKSADASRPALKLAVSRLPHGIFRVVVDDDDSAQLPHERPPVPDILVERAEPLALSSHGLRIGDRSARLEVPGANDGVAAVLDFDPFELRVETDDGVVVSRFNAEGRLRLEDFVPRPGEDAPSPESFRNYSDPVARGPESPAVDIGFPFASALHGLPQRTMPCALPDTVAGQSSAQSGDTEEPFRLYNLDVCFYKLNAPIGLYGTIPFLVARATDETRRAAGALWMNASETYVDTRSPTDGGRSTHWFSETGVVDVFLLPGPRVEDVWKQYVYLTGEPTFQQRFVMGYHQCRYSYLTQSDACEVDSKFDELDIPYDVLWLDIDHTDNKRYFTWDKTAYPDPDSLISDLAAKSRRVVTIVDPHIKEDDGYHIHDMATAEDLYVKDTSGKPYVAECWPGKSSWLDFTSARVRERWASQFNAENYPHFAPTLNIWNDMNEPAIFGGHEQTMPKNLLHEGGVEHRHVHNMYGHDMISATYAGLLAGKNGTQRPFILTRSFFAGSHRYAAVWTGDNTADWGHLRASVPMLMSLQLAGIGLAGADIGGFFDDPTPELATRWFQAAALQPFFRGHANEGTARAEPWVYGQPWTSLIRAAIRMRYSFLPMLYTLSAAASVGAVGGFNPRWIGPIMRPVWWEFGGEDDDRAWMVGRALLVAPVMEQGATTHSVRLPQGALWYDLLDPAAAGRRVQAPDGGDEAVMAVDMGRMVVLQRGGTAIARAASLDGVNGSDAIKWLEIVVAADEKGSAVGEVFSDDGVSFAFQNGAFVTARVTLDGTSVRSARVGGGQGYVGGEETVVSRVTVLGASRCGMEDAKCVRVSGSERQGRQAEEASVRYEAETDVATIEGVRVRLDEAWTVELV